MNFMSIIVILVIVLNAAFVAGVLLVNKEGGVVSDALIASWFAFTTVQLWNMRSIKVAKIKREGEKDDKV